MTPPASAPTSRPAPSRLIAVDVARALALIGMMTVHVLPGPVRGGFPMDRDPFTATAYALASGRSAALFAVLAGVGLALGRPSRTEVVIRALAVTAIGLSLGFMPTPAAVILVSYGVLFLLAVPFLRLGVRALAALAVLWVVLAPVASHLLRAAGLEAYPERNPRWDDLAHPLVFARNLLLTGYYPAFVWLGYLLAGLAAGVALRVTLRRGGKGRGATGSGLSDARAGVPDGDVAEAGAGDLHAGPDAAAASGASGPAATRTVAIRLVAAGAGAAVAGWLLGVVTLALAGGTAALNDDLAGGPPNSGWLTGRGDDVIGQTFYGTTPASRWWWLGIRAPHSGSVADLLHTGGCALAVLGICLLVVPWLWARVPRLVRPFAAAGSMTLTIYTLHVTVIGLIAQLEPGDRPPVWLSLAAQVVIALVAADRWRFGGDVELRGPLEELVSAAVEPVRERR